MYMNGIHLGYGTSNELKKYKKKLGIDMRREFMGSIISSLHNPNRPN